MPKAAPIATKLENWKAPTITKNSPIKPLVPGSPIEDNTKIIKTVEYIGILLTRPP